MKYVNPHESRQEYNVTSESNILLTNLKNSYGLPFCSIMIKLVNPKAIKLNVMNE